MQTKTETRPSVHQLEYLPGLAQYILRDRLQDFVSLQMRFINEVPLPLMRFFGQLSYQEQERLVREGAEKLLGYLARNEPAAFIEESVTQWEQNQMPVLDQSDITAEDITMATYLRKKSLLHFIPDYASGVDHIVALVNEIDLFLAEAETIFTNQYISLLRNKINEHAHFIEKITNTTPGIIYVYDVKNEREVYANRATSDFLGYSQEEIRSMGKAFVPRLIHPDDIGRLRDYEKDFQSTSDGEIRSFEYRFRNRSNEYRWLRTFETVFRRDAAGNISEKIGIAIDIHDQKLVSEELARGEAQLIEAQEIAQLGSFTWNLDTHHSTGTEQTYRILEIEPENFGSFIERVHPADQERVNEKFREAMRNGSFNCEFRYRANGSEKVIWSRGKVHFENAHPVSMTGIVMDVTEHEQLVEKLQQSEEAYKRAEAITHLGNYIWKLSDNALTWSDEMYRIYGLEPQCCKIDYDFAMSFVHPDDAPQVAEALAKAAERGGTFDFYSRIITHDGREKIVHSIGHYITDEKGRAVSAIGTAQDVTEKQKLIRQLERTQNMYRQAEELANIGNWIWDMKSKKLEWTDQLYRIYGLEPQSMPITIDTFLSFIHPDDRPAVEDGIEELYRTNYIDYTFRIIAKDGREKILRSVAHVERDENGQPVLAIGTERDVTEKTMMIRQLQESEYLYKQAQALTHVGNWTMDLQTNEFSWSDEMYNIYQLPIGTAFNIKDWEAYIHPDEKEALLEYMKECIEKKLPYEKIHRILLPDGTVKTLHRKAEFLYDEQGNAVKMIGTTQDITRQYRTEQELRDNQTFIRKITDATPSIIASYNINTGNYVFVSEGLEKLLGYDTQEVFEKGVHFFMDLFHPDDVLPMMEKNMKALAEANADPTKNDLVMEFTYRMRHRNGEYRWFHTYGTIFDRNSEGKVEHVLNISLDITEQKAAAERLEEQEYFIQQIADASPTILYLFDVDKQGIAYMNREIFFVLGYLPEEIISMGSDITELYHPEDFHLLPERRNSGKVFQQVDSMIQYECRIRHKDGDWRWFLCREIVFKVTADGSVDQILGAALDINRRKEMERTILQNTMLLEQSNASLEEFAYVASHDLKEPLRKISTFGDRLVASQLDNLTPEGKIYLNKIVDASQRMQTMISDLLSISMITGNKSFETSSLQKILDETMQTLEYKIEQQHAVIRYDMLPEAKVIPSQMRQLFQNLLSNSLKFVRDGVQPVITITHSYIRGEDMVHYQLAPAERYHRIQLTDNGIGFENEFAGKIFAIFQRLHGRSEYEGSGIGLAICKKIVEHHGGIIYAAGEPDVGATFTIILPA